jgi:TonB-linked SusC/RagA family outer membrane protein
VISFVGLKTQEVTIGASNEINIVMQPDILKLNELVVTGIGISRETKALGYSVQDVSGDVIARSHNDNVINSLNGKVAGVQVTSSTGAAGGSSYLTVRGPQSIEGSNQPLFVVDGVPIDNSQAYSGNPDDGTNNLTNGVAYSNRAIDLNPEDIESVTVLKGGAASALYGLRGSNGVVVVTTKKGKPVVGGKKYSLNFSSSVTLDVVNKLPEMQDKWAQGSGGKWKGPETANRNSWGPLMDTMRYAETGYFTNAAAQDPYNLGYYNWDKNGILVGMHDAHATGKEVNAYDNNKDFFKTGTTFNNALSIAGGNADATYYFSLSSLKNNGIVPNNEFHKTTVKIGGETKFSTKVSASGSINYINSGGTRLQQGSNLSGVMLGLMRTPPSFDNSNGYSKEDGWNKPYDHPEAYMFPDGSQRSFRGFGIYDNPFWSVNKNKFKDDVNRVIGVFQFNYLPLDWLSITYRLGNDFYSDRRNGHLALGSGEQALGRIQEDQHFNLDLNSDLLLNIKRDLTKDIQTNITLGNNMYQTKYQQLFVQYEGLSQPDFYHISNGSSGLAREIRDGKRTAAFYGDFGFSYRSMLFLNLTGRNEWSTTLPKGKNSFFFPSVSAGFVFTELDPLKNKILPFGKLRISYAITANDAPTFGTNTYFAPGYYGDGWTSGVSFPFNGTTAYQKDDILGNSDLKPEKMEAFEFGADFRFWENRARLDIAYYKNTNKDLILQVPVAGSSGYIVKVLNAATMENKGIELLASGTPVKTKDFDWTLTLNFSSNKNEVTKLAEGIDNVDLGGFVGSTVRAVKGQPYATIYGTQFMKDGNGNVIIDDEGTAATNPHFGYPFLSEEEAPYGSAQPDYTLGITNDFTYKDFTLSFLVDVRHGAYMWNGTRGIMYALGTHKDTEDRGTTTVFEGVKGHYLADGTLVTSGTNDISIVKGEKWYNGLGGGFGGPTEQFIEKTDWVRLREVTLAYNLSEKLVKKIGFQNISVFFTAKNLLLFTDYKGIDPETNLYGASNAQGLDYFNMPNTKSYILGLKVAL